MNVCIGFEINLVCILSPLVCDSNSMQISLVFQILDFRKGSPKERTCGTRRRGRL